MQIVELPHQECYEKLAETIIFAAYKDYYMGRWSYDDLARWANSSGFKKLTTLNTEAFLKICKKAKELNICNYTIL